MLLKQIRKKFWRCYSNLGPFAYSVFEKIFDGNNDLICQTIAV